MLLIVTNSADATANYLCGVLRASDVPYFRLNTDCVVAETVTRFNGDALYLTTGSLTCEPNDFAHVWYRRPVPLSVPNAAEEISSSLLLGEFSEIVESFLLSIPEKRWMNHPHCNAIASRKIPQLQRARQLGLHVPDTIVTQDASLVREFFAKHGGAIVTKMLSSASLGQAESKSNEGVIYTSRVTAQHLAKASLVANCPTLFQQEIVDKLDVRVTVVDDRIGAVALHRASREGTPVDIRYANMSGVKYEKISIPETVRVATLELVRSYGLRFAAIDFAMVPDGEFVFLELNPNGQWAWTDVLGETRLAAMFVEAFSV